jgi:DNA-binding GntR family transcriptional regulator
MTDALEGLVGVSALRERQTAAGYVADSLREAIRSGTLADGTELNQVALAERFGISRVPVREALRALEGEGWITALPHRRAVVLSLPLERVREIFEVRALLEKHLLSKAIPAWSASTISRLEGLCDAMDRCADHREWVALNQEYHATLLAPAGSPLAVELLEQLGSQVERYVRSLQADVAREREAGHEHRDIVAAAKTGDVARATALIDDHIARTAELVVAAIAHDRTPEER